MGRSEGDKEATEPFHLSESVSHLLHRIAQLADEHFSGLAGESITLRQFAVLAAISQSPGLSQAELGRAAGIDRSTLVEAWDVWTGTDESAWGDAVAMRDQQAMGGGLQV